MSGFAIYFLIGYVILSVTLNNKSVFQAIKEIALTIVAITFWPLILLLQILR